MNRFLKISLISSLITTASFAINIDEAVQIALKNNQDLQNKSIEVSQSLDNKDVAISGFLPKLDISYGYNDINKPMDNQRGQSATLSSKISYNLFNGFKDIAGYEIADLNFKSTQYYFESLKFDTILNVKKSYVNYLNSVNNKDTFDVQYKLFKKQYEDSKAKYEQGLLAKNDLLQVQVNMSNALQNLTSAEANVHIAKLELSNILGGYDLSNENIEPLSVENLEKIDLKDKTIDNRSELKALEMSLKSLMKNNTLLNSSFYPKVDGNFSHNNYYEDSVLGKYESGVDEQTIASINFSWNLYYGNSDNTKKLINKKEISKLNNEIQKTKLALNLQLSSAKSNYEVALVNYDTATLSLDQAKENYSIVKSRFDEGISSSTDLIDANYLLTYAKQNYFKAYFDKYISLETLKRVLEDN